MVAIDSLPVGHYTLEFIVPNQDGYFESVPSKEVTIVADQVTKINQSIRPKVFAEIANNTIDSAKKLFSRKNISLAKIGDGYEIGIYEITNKQFARWLNQASEQKKIYIVDDPARKGWILDGEGNLLFKCKEADGTSQISLASSHFFEVVPGKEHYPVIQVSWYGAKAFCKDLGFRLPTEADWVYAAAQSRNEDHRIFLYGFSRDTISPVWANYKFEESPIKNLEVKTTRVGFYNGKNKIESGLMTMDAKSPFGLYDMSGNVGNGLKIITNRE